jgi:gamma-glutamyltranspeptidase/glutathione hydrolase
MADESLDWFYRGDFAKRYVATVQKHGGRLTMDDMARGQATTIEVEAAPVGTYRGHEVHAPLGFTVGLALQAIEAGDLGGCTAGPDDPDSVYALMRLVEEVWHFGLALKPEDSQDWMDQPTDKSLMRSKAAAEQLWQRVLTEPSRPYDPMHPGTNAIVVADEAGNVAFGTHSCSCRPFGAGLVVDGVWVSRPLLAYGQPAPLPAGITTSLLLAKEGKPVFATGSPSISCLTNILQNTVNVVEYGLTLEESVNRPLFGAPRYPSRRAMIEGNYPQAVYDSLDRRGMAYQRISPQEPEMGSCQAVTFDHANGVIHGVADPRRRGQAAGL